MVSFTFFSVTAMTNLSFPYRLEDPRIGVAERGAPDTRLEIDVPVPRGVVQARPLRADDALEDQLVTGIPE